MTKDVLVSIKGLQFESGSDEAVESISSGEYYFRNGKHYALYEEVLEESEGSGEIVKNTVKISKDQVEIQKKGGSNVHMLFKENQRCTTYYRMPFGQLMISIFTNQIKIEEKNELIEVKLYYDLEINQSFVSNCELTLLIIAKDSKVATETL